MTLRTTLTQVFLLFAGIAFAQTAPLAQQDLPYDLDSGFVRNLAESRTVIFAEEIVVPKAAYLRLRFAEVQLGETPRRGQPTVLRITSLEDGAVQHLNALHLEQWRNTSAYFNGDAVRLELIADAGAQPSRVVIERIWAGPFLSPTEKSICGATDDRIPSSDPRNARIVPIGCTGWLFDDANHTFGTAGHCLGSGMQVVEFNVPLSTSGGSLRHPGPEDQYAVDASSTQGFGNGVGDDWAYFGCFDNTETGMSAYLAQGVSYNLVDAPTSASGTIRITGYGTTSSPVPFSYYQAQKTHTGPFSSVSGFLLRYAADTTGGNSGSPIIHEDTGEVIGVHTHAGCSSGGGSNQGTSSRHTSWKAALAAPLGVCIPIPLEIALPDGAPATLPESGAVVRVEIDARSGHSLQAGTAKLHYDDGGGFQELPLTEISPGVYDAEFPNLNCLDELAFRFSAKTATNVEVFYPDVDQAIHALVATQGEPAFADDFETNLGWSVSNDPGLTHGAWERTTPDGDGVTGTPAFDADHSGQCYLTQAGTGDTDVDGGHTVLTSPTMDATAVTGEPYLSYSRWFNNQFGLAVDDSFVISISNDNGANWQVLETVGPTGGEAFGGWIAKRFRIADLLTPTSQMRLRFDVSDTGTDSLVEAAVDAVTIVGYSCALPCPGDLDGDREVGKSDFALALASWGSAQASLDLDGNAQSNLLDLLLLPGSYGACP